MPAIISPDRNFNDSANWLTEPKAIPVIRLKDPLFDLHGVELWVARLDLVHPYISGNKWFKLKNNLLDAIRLEHRHIVSFGGAFSNHLHALAAACHYLDIKSTGVLRGELIQPLNPTLSDCEAWGMSFLPVTRAEYREKNSVEFYENIEAKLGRFYLIPEGGSNVLALKGVAESAKIIIDSVGGADYLCSAVGSGGTLAGLTVGAESSVKCVGFSALKGAEYIEQEIDALIKEYYLRYGGKFSSVHRVVHDYHFGGFAKTRPELISFMLEFEGLFDIPLEHVYTAKMFYGIFDQIRQGGFERGSRIVAVHTGGLQGRRGLK